MRGLGTIVNVAAVLLGGGLALVIGALVGETLNIEVHIEKVGEKIKSLVHAKKEAGFVDSFVTATLVICVGVNLTFGKRIRVGNFLPAMLVPVLYHLLF